VQGYGRRQWLLDCDILVSPVDYVAYFHLIGTSGDTHALIIISRTSVDHRILIDFTKVIIDYEKNGSLTSLHVTGHALVPVLKTVLATEALLLSVSL